MPQDVLEEVLMNWMRAEREFVEPVSGFNVQDACQ